MSDNDHVAQNIKLWDRFVEAYKARFMDLGLYKDSFGYLIDNLPKNASVIELGCGPGNVIHYLKSKRNDLSFFGTDLAPAMVKAAEDANPGEAFAIMDLRDAGSIDRTFDCVIAAFSIPYVTHNDLPGVFASIRKLANENAFVYISFMEGPAERSGYEITSFTADNGMYISYYSRDEIESWLIKNGFQIKQVQKQDYHEKDGSITIDVFITAQKV